MTVFDLLSMMLEQDLLRSTVFVTIVTYCFDPVALHCVSTGKYYVLCFNHAPQGR